MNYMHYAIYGFTACINMSNSIVPLSFVLVHNTLTKVITN